MSGHTTPVRALAITPTGRQIVSASVGGTVRIWDRATGNQIGEPFAGHSGHTMALTPDGDRIISGNDPSGRTAETSRCSCWSNSGSRR